MSTRRAFTLIELLVVVAIIVALLAILLPSMNKAIGLAQQAACMANQRQIGYAWKAYAVDHRGQLFSYTLVRSDRKIWTEVLRDYVSEVGDVVICPSTENPPGAQGIGNVGIADVRMGGADLAWIERRAGRNSVEPFDRGSYTYNGNMNPDSVYNTAAQRYQSLTDIVQSHRVPILGDGDWRVGSPGTTGSVKLFPSNLQMPQTVFGGNLSIDGAWRWATSRHEQRSGILFADGHVEPIDLPDLWQLKWHKTYDTTVPVSGAP